MTAHYFAFLIGEWRPRLAPSRAALLAPSPSRACLWPASPHAPLRHVSDAVVTQLQYTKSYKGVCVWACACVRVRTHVRVCGCVGAWVCGFVWCLSVARYFPTDETQPCWQYGQNVIPVLQCPSLAAPAQVHTRRSTGSGRAAGWLVCAHQILCACVRSTDAI